MSQELKYIETKVICPHPDNPRKDLGDLTELSESIKVNGVLQNLTVVPFGGMYRVVIGHRRLAAAKLAGLETVPCVIADLTPEQQVATMLLENMQRSDLTPYEEAQGFQMMLDLGETVATVASRTGFSATKVRRRVEWTKLDQQLLQRVSQERQISISDLDKLSQIDDLEERNAALKKIGTNDYEWDVKSRIRAQKIAKNKPLVMGKIKELGYTELPPDDRYSGKYEKLGSKINFAEYTKDVEFPSADGKQKVYYDAPSFGGYVQFYVRKQKAARVKKSQEEIDEAKRLKRIWAEATEKAATAYACRLEFVRNLKLNKKNTEIILKMAIKGLVIGTLSYLSSNNDFGKEIFGIENNSFDSKKHVQQAFRLLDSPDAAKLVPVAIMAAFGDSSEMSYFSDNKHTYPKYQSNRQLDIIYEWLWDLGYEMSEEEKQIKDGTHPIFKEMEYVVNK